jgi:hypothetical protein
LKVDVEGVENNVLTGAEQILVSGVNDLLLCTYHRSRDSRHFSQWLSEKKYEIKFSQGYMLFIWEKENYSLKEPFDFRIRINSCYKNDIILRIQKYAKENFYYRRCRFSWQSFG